MHALFCEEITGIYRLKVPFEKIYTSVFLIRKPEGLVLVDCATTTEDVDTYIVPALAALGVAPPDLSVLVLTHRHGDHAGGMPRLLELAPGLAVVTEVCALFGGLSTYPMAGHTTDSIGVYDATSRTLLSGDGLQGAGVDRFRCSTKDPDAYRETLARVRGDERIENVLFSHAYEPWNCEHAFGRDAVLSCLDDCEAYVAE